MDEQQDEPSTGQTETCQVCGEAVLAGAAKCPACGWPPRLRHDDGSLLPGRHARTASAQTASLAMEKMAVVLQGLHAWIASARRRYQQARLPRLIKLPVEFTDLPIQ
jgi:hypothetical protein